MNPPLPKKMAEMTADDWRAWYARILADGPEPECTTGDPKFIGDLRKCDHCGGSLGTDYHSQVYEEDGGTRIAECRCKKCDTAHGQP